MKKSLFVMFVAALMCMLCVMAVSASGSETPEFSGGQLKITEAGTYRFVGSMRGTVLVDPGEGDVVLVMDNFTLDGGSSAGIVALSGDSLTISMADNSVNRIADGGNDKQFDAAIYSRVPTFFEGNGSMDVRGNNREAIHVENADLTFNNGNFNMSAPLNTIAVDGEKPGMLTFDNGSFFLNSESSSISQNTNIQFRGGKVWETDINGSIIAPSWGSNNNELPTTEVFEMNQPQDMNQMPWMNQNQNNEYFTSEQQPAAQQASWQQPAMPGQSDQMPGNTQQASRQQPNMPGEMQQPGMINTYESAASASEIITGTMTNSAMNLTADYDNATTITVTDDNSQVKISESGTYIVTGSSSDGNITVKKETTGVVLVLENLDLTSTTGATVSINKNAEVQVIISGNVVLTDAENPADENSTDADIADAFDGAALKAKAGSEVYMTGDGTLTINGNAKNGIKGGDDSSIIIDGVTMNITAVNDGINSNYDITLLGGNFTINAADDAIHTDHILTIGDENGDGPTVRVNNSNEGLEGTVVNILGGDININSTDDAINAANSDGLYEGELNYAINMTGGEVIIRSQGDGMDSNGNINLIGGSLNITSATVGGEAGIDYDGQLYISNEFQLNNNSGVAGPDGMPGGMNGQNFGPQDNGQQGGFPQSGSNDFGGQQGGFPQNVSNDFGGQQGGFPQNDSINFGGQQGGFPQNNSNDFGGQQGGFPQNDSNDFGGQQGGFPQNGSNDFGGQQGPTHDSSNNDFEERRP